MDIPVIRWKIIITASFRIQTLHILPYLLRFGGLGIIWWSKKQMTATGAWMSGEITKWLHQYLKKKVVLKHISTKYASPIGNLPPMFEANKNMSFWHLPVSTFSPSLPPWQSLPTPYIHGCNMFIDGKLWRGNAWQIRLKHWICHV